MPTRRYFCKIGSRISHLGIFIIFSRLLSEKFENFVDFYGMFEGTKNHWIFGPNFTNPVDEATASQHQYPSMDGCMGKITGTPRYFDEF